MAGTAVEGYAAAAAALIEKYEAIDPDVLYRPLAAWMPGAATRVADLGAGTGRDAAWLAARGCRVLAVEPVAAFRAAGRQRHPSRRIRWLDDSLPALAAVTALGERFGTLLRSGVWQHLDRSERRAAMLVMAGLLAAKGRIVLSLRHGLGAPGRPVHAAPPAEAIAAGDAAGLLVVYSERTGSAGAANRAAGVTWIWLVLEAR